MSCAIAGCRTRTSRQQKNAECELISFHKFPAEVETRQEWINAIGRMDWEWKNYHRICSKHFTSDCFINFSYKWRRLRANSVPSLHLHNDPYNEYRSPQVSVLDEPPSTTDSFHGVFISTDLPSEAATPTSAGSSAEISSCSQHNHLIYEINQLKHDIEVVKITAKRRLLKMNALRQKTKRLTKKNYDLQIRLTDLLEKDKIEKRNIMKHKQNKITFKIC